MDIYICMYVKIVHDAEDHLELCKLNAEKARERLMEVGIHNFYNSSLVLHTH